MASPQTRDGGPPSSDSTVLVIEVEVEEARFLLEALGRREGEARVEATSSPSRALELLDHRDFDCIVQAFDLPEMHGIKLVRQLRDRGHELPVVVRTDREPELLEEKVLDAGADAFLSKDGTEKEVRRTVWGLVARSSA